ncbi:MAG: IS66 family transposase, partial [Nitrospira sp.]|nr:IS66 family transposase [Nitrospira sp.]
MLPTDSSEVALLKRAWQKEREAFAKAQRELAWAKLKIQVLEEARRKLLLAKYGPSSEKLSDAQLSLLELEPGVSNEEVKAEAERDQEELEQRPKRNRERKPHPGRQTLPANLPRIEEIVPVPAAQCLCGACGKDMPVIGYEESEQLDVKPAEYFVRVLKREKRACGACGKGGVKTAPVVPSIIDKCLVSDRIVVETVIAKYLDHLPLYRQSAMLARDAGLEIHRSTMDGWVMRVGELLEPIAQAMRRELLTGNYIQADETPIEVQMHDGRGKNHQAYLWQYSYPGGVDSGGMYSGGMYSGGVVLFDFQMGRGREAPKRMLRDFAGILQTDGYAAYDKVGAPGIVQAACWAHARRKFVEALKLNAKDAEAARIVSRMDALFAIDAEARDAVMSIEQRHALRAERAAPLVAELREELLRLQKSTLPKSALGQAVNYTLSLWMRLTVFLTHPVVELSNNLAENSMRGVALGRKNWIHLGSENAGPKVAAILSIAETCRRLGLPVRDYMLEVLPGMADRKRSEVEKLTP